MRMTRRTPPPTRCGFPWWRTIAKDATSSIGTPSISNARSNSAAGSNSWLAAEENAKLAPAETALLGPLLGNAARSRDYFYSSSGPETINSEGLDRIIRLKHYIWEELMPRLSARIPSLSDLAGEFAFFRDEWHERNQIMADNIASQARKRPVQRIVVLCGCEH